MAGSALLSRIWTLQRKFQELTGSRRWRLRMRPKPAAPFQNCSAPILQWMLSWRRSSRLVRSDAVSDAGADNDGDDADRGEGSVHQEKRGDHRRKCYSGRDIAERRIAAFKERLSAKTG